MSPYDQYFHSTTTAKRTETLITSENLAENIIPIRSAAFRTAGELVDVVGVVVHYFSPTTTSTGGNSQAFFLSQTSSLVMLT